MYQAGADIVYHAAGGSGGGVFQAAKAAGKLRHRRRLRPGQLTRYAAVSRRHHHLDDQEGRRRGLRLHHLDQGRRSSQAGNKVFDLKAGGIDYSTTGGQIDDIKGQLDEFKQKIISGEIKVPTTP